MSRDRTFGTDGIPRSVDRPRWRVVYGCGSDPAVAGAEISPSDGPTNMAIDQALLESVKAGAGVVPAIRLYRWSPACLSFGRNQPARGCYDADAAAARGIDFVRRPTGGQAVLHDDELTYAVVAPVSAIGRPRAAYSLINRALVDGLSRLGVPAALAGDGGLRGRVGAAGLVAEDAGAAAGQPPAGQSIAAQQGSSRQAVAAPDWDPACFRRPERGEVVCGGAKLVGSAQRVEDRVILQHGSILVGGSQAPAEELLRESISRSGSSSISGSSSEGRGEGGWTTLERELGRRPAIGEIAATVVAGFGEVLGVALVPAGLTEAEGAVVTFLRDRFASDAWTWRR